MARVRNIKRRSLEISCGSGSNYSATRRRRATVYDAVAGKVSQKGFIDHHSKDYHKNSKQPLRPDEVLFKQSKAPVRYQENDYYYANESLPSDQPLPNGDLLSAIHGHVSKLYARTHQPGSVEIWQCMDETALMAFGILMEETAKEVLGETGDFAFAEGAKEDEERAFATYEEEKKEYISNLSNVKDARGDSDSSEDFSTSEDEPTSASSAEQPDPRSE